MMAKQLLLTNIKREKGKLYFCGTSKDGFIVVSEAIMARGRAGTKKKKKA